MKLSIGKVYKNEDGNFFTPAQNGNYYICDMWECTKEGEVSDIEDNPCPIPVLTNNLVYVGKSNFDYSYPDFNPLS